jgi:hypothetical protein
MHKPHHGLGKTDFSQPTQRGEEHRPNNEQRENAVAPQRHGLTAATDVTAIEDSQQFELFEAAARVDYRPNSMIEHELIARLTSLFCGPMPS